MSEKFIGKKLVIASNNPGKAKEIWILLKPYDIEVISVADLNIEEPYESGATFVENSRLKAEYYGKLLNLPALADDSGICIDALGGFPGIYSARVAGPNKDYNQAFKDIETKLHEKKIVSSAAHFICSLTLWQPDCAMQDFEGRIDGVISFPAKGDKGFGFDPLFTPNGYSHSFAEINPEIKNKISHRSIAFKKFVETCF